MKLMKDIRDVSKDTPEGIIVHFSEENLSCINADIKGPGIMLSKTSRRNSWTDSNICNINSRYSFWGWTVSCEATNWIRLSQLSSKGWQQSQRFMWKDWVFVLFLGYFLTKIFHPNVSAKGEICVNTLKKDWKPSHGLRHVLMVVEYAAKICVLGWLCVTAGYQMSLDPS